MIYSPAKKKIKAARPARMRMLKEWGTLTEEEQKLIIPHILVATYSWRAWSTDRVSREIWLRDRFGEAGVKLSR